MAIVTGITAVRPTANTEERKIPYGATISVGQPLYRDPADANVEWKPADASSGSGDDAPNARCIAITPGVDGGYGLGAFKGDIILVGATMTAGQTYVVDDTAGQIATEDELGTGDRVTILGVAVDATTLRLKFQTTGISHA